MPNEPLSGNHQMDAAIRSLQLRAWSCAVTVRIARVTGSAETSWKTASGVLIEFRRGAVIATSWHVLEEFRRLRATGETVALVCGNLPIPAPRTVYRDETADIAFIQVPAQHHGGIGAVPYRPGTAWPPVRVVAEDAVLLCGFPKRFRHDGTEILHGDLNLLLSVSTVADDHFKLQVDWPSLVQAGRAKLPLGQTDFGGVSGGPVFLWDGGGNPLVGLIAEAGDTLPIWRVAALAGVSFDPEAVKAEPV